jgi:hypothetical protein
MIRPWARNPHSGGSQATIWKKRSKMNTVAAGQSMKAPSTAKTAWLLGNGQPPWQSGAAGNIKFQRSGIILSRGVGHPVRSCFNVEEKEP